MQLSELFQQPGLGVMATSSSDGSVNTAVYARPHVHDEKTLVWGMTDRRTFHNISQNPRASYLFRVGSGGFSGVRLSLELIKSEEDGEMLTLIKHNADSVVGPGTGAAVTHAVWFKVVEVRPLI